MTTGLPITALPAQYYPTTNDMTDIGMVHNDSTTVGGSYPYYNVNYLNTTYSANMHYGYACACGAWVAPNTLHQCYYVNYPTVTQWSSPQTITIYNGMPDSLEEKLDALEERLGGLEDALERLVNLLGKVQDEEVCGYTEGGCSGVDEERVPVAALETKAPAPRGATAWPPRS